MLCSDRWEQAHIATVSMCNLPIGNCYHFCCADLAIAHLRCRLATAILSTSSGCRLWPQSTASSIEVPAQRDC
jgi:hypothetical protein